MSSTDRLPPPIPSIRILGYHGVNPRIPDGITIKPEQFAAQMETLARQGIRGVCLRRLAEEARTTGRWPTDKVAITFDDGYRDCLSYAEPILRRHGFHATVFVITDALTSPAGIAHCHPQKEFLTRNEVQALLHAGWELGSHTLSHRRLPSLPPAERRREIFQAKEVLEKEFTVPVDSFCCPGGRWDEEVRQLILAAGYRQAVVTPAADSGTQPECWTMLERAGVYPGNSLAMFQFKLRPSYRVIRPIFFLGRRWLGVLRKST